jgi:hypothetical protein
MARAMIQSRAGSPRSCSSSQSRFIQKKRRSSAMSRESTIEIRIIEVIGK